MLLTDIITIDKAIQGGQPVFTGTRVPVESLFDHLERGISLNNFLKDFPTVKKETAISLLKIAYVLISLKLEIGLVREPLHVDFVVDPRPLTKAEKKAISDFILADKLKQ